MLSCVLYGQDYDPPDGYYDNASGLTGTALRNAVYEIINDHTWYPYSSGSTDTWDILDSADQDPGNSSNILDVYKNASYTKEGGGNDNYNREHTWPKSYGFHKEENYNYPYTDCHALLLANSGYNSSRTNKPYDDCDENSTEKATEVNNDWGGGSGSYPGNSNWTDGGSTTGDGSTPGSGDKWETWKERQGDVARALFYLDVRYAGDDHGSTGEPEPDLILTDNLSEMVCRTEGTYGSNANVANTDDRRAYMGLLSTLKQWHADDPVDEVEQRRNHIVYGHQGNRNPFIDNPTWVDAIFGSPSTTVQFITSAASVHEEDGTYSLTIAISSPHASTATTVDVALTGGTGTASDINNYSTQTVTFSGGSSTDQTVTLTITDDSINEENETFILSLQSASGGNSASVGSNDQFTLTINANDGPDIFINEIHYDNASTDANEGVEVVVKNPGNYTLSDFTVTLYNGANGASYDSETLDNFTVGNTMNDYTLYYKMISGIQNGSPDGIALDSNGVLIQFLSYEGTFAATNGVANEITSTDIGVSESGSTTSSQSLQLTGDGLQSSDFSWSANIAQTWGTLNNGGLQSINSVTISGSSNHFRMMSSPVAGQIYSDLLSELWTQGMTNGDTYTGTANVWTYDGSSWNALSNLNTATQTAGAGFLVFVYVDTDNDGDTGDTGASGYLPVTLSVSGTVNSSSATVPSSGSIDADAWELAGNPYASTIDWDNVTKTNVTTSAYVWDSQAGTPAYISWNGSSGSLTDGLIAPYQGFWVQGDGGTGSITIETADKSSSSGTFYKTMTDSTGSMSFSISSGNYSDQTFVSFMTDGAEGMDNADAYKLLPMSPSERIVGISYAEGNGLDISNLPYSHEGSIAIPLDIMYLTVDDDYNFVTNENEGTMSWDLSSLPKR
jgi:endonuclease I